jgi:hypothetical protein
MRPIAIRAVFNIIDIYVFIKVAVNVWIILSDSLYSERRNSILKYQRGPGMNYIASPWVNLWIFGHFADQ